MIRFESETSKKKCDKAIRFITNNRDQFLLPILRILNAKQFFDSQANFQQNEVHWYGIPFKNFSDQIELWIDFWLPVILDIGANLTDGMFQGIYNGTQKHPNDLDIVLKRSWTTGLDKIIITVGTITDTDEAAKVAQTDGMTSYSNSLISFK